MEQRPKGIVDIRKPINQLPECGVEGCSNNGWIGLGGKFVCGECLIKWQRLQSEKMYEELRK